MKTTTLKLCLLMSIMNQSSPKFVLKLKGTPDPNLRYTVLYECSSTAVGNAIYKNASRNSEGVKNTAISVANCVCPDDLPDLYYDEPVHDMIRYQACGPVFQKLALDNNTLTVIKFDGKPSRQIKSLKLTQGSIVYIEC